MYLHCNRSGSVWRNTGILGRGNWVAKLILSSFITPRKNRKELWAISGLGLSNVLVKWQIFLSYLYRLRIWRFFSTQTRATSFHTISSLYCLLSHAEFLSLLVTKYWASHIVLSRNFPWKKHNYVVSAAFLFSSNEGNKHFYPVLKFSSCNDSVMLWNFQPNIQKVVLAFKWWKKVWTTL